VSSPPTPEAQLAFLTKLQRIFAEGDFTSTYKFALLIALAECAVEFGNDDSEPLNLSNRVIANKFIGLYWQQSTPYSSGQKGTCQGVLNQNKGAQAAVISAIAEFRQRHANVTLLSAIGLEDDYSALCNKVAETVSAQPINFLQNFAGQTDQFLFERCRGGIVLKPGVTYCLRRFQPLVQQLARQHWVNHVKHNRLNAGMFGQRDDLESFLFETSRQSLMIIGNGLRKLTGNQCFYCQSKVQEADVDHFVPFSLYPRDLIHNFVLTHPSCNRSKSDTLGARLHLVRWLEFISRNDTTLREIGVEAGRDADVSASHAVARWGYGNAIASGARAWVKVGAYEAVDDSYLGCLM
jgi:hypothetical protein